MNMTKSTLRDNSCDSVICVEVTDNVDVHYTA